MIRWNRPAAQRPDVVDDPADAARRRAIRPSGAARRQAGLAVAIARDRLVLMTHRPRLRRLPWRLFGLLAVPVVLLLADFLVWHATVQRLRDGFATASQTLRDGGWVIAAGAVTAEGWPFAARLRIADFALSAPDALPVRDLAWRSGALTLQVALVDPHALTIGAAGAQTLRLGDRGELAVTAERLDAMLPLQADSPPGSAHISARHLDAALTGASPSPRLGIGALDLQLDLHPTAAPDAPALAYALTAEDIDLPDRPVTQDQPATAHQPATLWALGRTVALLRLDGTITGMPPAAMPLAAALATWRDGGGGIAVHAATLHWGPLAVTGSATLSLDQALQPMGTGTARMTGQDAALDAMAASGAIKPAAALAAKAVLGLLGTPATAGDPASVEVPLTLQDRTLEMGRIPLQRLPRIVWPGTADTVTK
jgi:hypothetical protein